MKQVWLGAMMFSLLMAPLGLQARQESNSATASPQQENQKFSVGRTISDVMILGGASAAILSFFLYRTTPYAGPALLIGGFVSAYLGILVYPEGKTKGGVAFLIENLLD